VADPFTTPVAPFNPAATQEPSEGSGCGKPALIGCGLLLVLVVAGMVAITLEMPALLRWSFRLAEAGLTPRLPADATAAERQRLRLAFQAAGRINVGDQAALARLQLAQKKVLALSGSTGPLTRQQLRELTEALEAAAGKPPPPVPAPGALPAPPGTPRTPAAPSP
jgi:hypothetical protein